MLRARMNLRSHSRSVHRRSPRRRTPFWGAVLVVGLSVMAVACDVPAGECPTEAALAGFCVPASPQDDGDAGWCTRHVNDCDIREDDCQAVIWEAVACLRESPDLTKPFVRVEPYPDRSDSQPTGDPGAGGGDAPAADPIEVHWGRTLEMLGLRVVEEPPLPEEPGVDEPVDASTDEPADEEPQEEEPTQAAPSGPTVASYDRQAGVVVIRDGDEALDPSAGLWRLTLAYVQAMQDQELDLDNYLDGWIESFDTWLSVNAATFGEAICYANAITLDEQRLDPRTYNYDGYYEGLMEDTRGSVASSPAPLEESASIFPVAYGGDMITRVYAESGPTGVREFVAAPPLTSAIPMARGGLDVPIEGAPMANRPLYDPVGDWTYLGRDVFGAWGLYAFLVRAGVDDDEAWTWALGEWQGDRVWIYYRDDPEDTLVLWQLRFTDPERVSDFVALADGVEGQLGSTWSARALDTDVLLAVGTDATPIASWLEALAPTP